MRRVKRIFLPSIKHRRRAHAVSHPALSGYIFFLFVFLFTFQLLARSTGLVLGYATNIYIEEILMNTNLEREKYGLSSLELNEQLSVAAKQKAEDMFKGGYWAHIAPDGTTPWYFIEQNGYSYIYAGENLAKDFNDSDAVVRAWMNSPTHKDNILGENYRDIGLAIVNGELQDHETTLVVQLFGGKQKSVTMATTKVTKEYTPKKIEVAFEGEANPALHKPQGVSQMARTKFEPLQEISPHRFDSANFVRISVLIFSLFVSFLFALDGFVARKRGTLRLTGKTIAHIGLLLFLLLIVWQVNVGVIL